MKKIVKLFVNLMTVVMLAIACFAFVGCEDIKTMEITIEAYNYTDEVMEEKTLTVELYRHLAPDTVDAIVEYAKDGYYDGCVFYYLSNYDEQIMIGDLKFDGTTLSLNDEKPTVKGEFENGATKGSDLVNAYGSVGLWRTWAERDNEVKAFRTSNGMNSGSATMFMPTTTLSNYDGYFCVFGQMDMKDEDNISAMSSVINALKEENRTTYVVYYTGEYGNLKLNYMKLADFEELNEEEIEALNIFEPTDSEYHIYAKHNIELPVKEESDVVGARIKSVKIK